MSAAIVPSGTALGVMLMPANPVSPFRAVNVERYAPGGGSKLVGDVGEDVADEHAAIISAHSIRDAIKKIGRSRSTTLAHTSLFVIAVPSVSKKRKPVAKTS